MLEKEGGYERRASSCDTIDLFIFYIDFMYIFNEKITGRRQVCIGLRIVRLTHENVTDRSKDIYMSGKC